MLGYNPQYIDLPETIDEALALPDDALRALLNDPDTAPTLMMLALPPAEEWFDSEAEMLEAALVT